MPVMSDYDPQHRSASFKFSSIPIVAALPSWAPKNVQSLYLRSGSHYLATDENVASLKPNPEENFADVLVIHPGSRNLRIGRAGDAFPKELPHVIVRRIRKATSPARVERAGIAGPFADEIRTAPNLFDAIHDDIKIRMRSQKIRHVPNARAQVVGFNSQAVPQSIPDHNDPYKIEWIDVGPDVHHVTGAKALRVAELNITQGSTTSDARCHAFYPIQHGLLNVTDYCSIHECLGDLQTIWTDALETELGIRRSEFKNFNVALVLPDLFSRVHARSLISLILKDMGFRAVTALQESVAATFGAGMTTACVIDIGAQKTSISCVEDGLCVSRSRVNLKYGGDDITAFFLNLLLDSSFPYKDIRVQTQVYDWLLADELKEKFCTCNEVDMAVNVCDFYVRGPRDATQLYNMKVYDEVLLAPRLLFHPYVVDFKRKLRDLVFRRNYLDDNADDELEGASIPILWNSSKQVATLDSKLDNDVDITGVAPMDIDEPLSAVSESGYPSSEDEGFIARRFLTSLEDITLPLDEAVAKSLSSYYEVNADLKDNDIESRIRKLCSSILVVGGGGMTLGMGKLLEERLSTALLATPIKVRLAGSSATGSTAALTPKVLQNPRDIDSRVLAWKGASVFAKLDMTGDLWVGAKEWALGGVTRTAGKWMFSWT
ncbi:hypothetical protein BC832DRAFT_545314 [Gaertneriomyces semiglobifer]|nr:hypothetical protein BC832DRAFT_545314 [Gaertneriomyces semiglobifer]